MSNKTMNAEAENVKKLDTWLCEIKLFEMNERETPIEENLRTW